MTPLIALVVVVTFFGAALVLLVELWQYVTRPFPADDADPAPSTGERTPA